MVVLASTKGTFGCMQQFSSHFISCNCIFYDKWKLNALFPYILTSIVQCSKIFPVVKSVSTSCLRLPKKCFWPLRPKSASHKNHRNCFHLKTENCGRLYSYNGKSSSQVSNHHFYFPSKMLCANVPSECVCLLGI